MRSKENGSRKIPMPVSRINESHDLQNNPGADLFVEMFYPNYCMRFKIREKKQEIS